MADSKENCLCDLTSERVKLYEEFPTARHDFTSLTCFYNNVYLRQSSALYQILKAESSEAQCRMDDFLELKSCFTYKESLVYIIFQGSQFNTKLNFSLQIFFFLFTIQQQIKTVKNEDQCISTLISSSVGP